MEHSSNTNPPEMTNTSADCPPDRKDSFTGIQQIEPEKAFELLGNDLRLATIRVLAGIDPSADVQIGDSPLSFSELQTAVGATSSAGFAYHLRQLTDHYVRKTDQGYRLSSAGQRVARAIIAETYTERIGFKDLPVPGLCPLCGHSDLTARCADNTLAVECECTAGWLAVLPLPPGSHHRPTDGDLLETFDRYHRSRIALMTDGICAECMGSIEATIEHATAPQSKREDGDEIEDSDRAQLQLNCSECSVEFRSPLVFAVVEHPAVIGFCDQHGIDIRERPLWNLGEEFSETILSDDPWCVRVSLRSEGDRLDILVGEGMTVHVLDIDDMSQSSTASASS